MYDSILNFIGSTPSTPPVVDAPPKFLDIVNNDDTPVVKAEKIGKYFIVPGIFAGIYTYMRYAQPGTTERIIEFIKSFF